MSNAKVIHGDCIEVMRTMDAESVDSIVTDPPYGLGFMGKKWDDLPPGREWAEECLRVLKPGGHMLAFGGTRTWHRLATAIEDAGFEMRDSIAWLYGSGFPKHRANLKPAFEPVVMARKPFKGSLTTNESVHGTGALSIEAARIAGGSGRWPTNVILDESQTAILDQQSGVRKSGGKSGIQNVPKFGGATYNDFPTQIGQATTGRSFGDVGGASRFFYCAKATKQERPVVEGVAHPTVKPVSLMRWLVRLVTPDGGAVLEPFAGSGATVEACILEGFNVIAIECEAEYLPLIAARIERCEAA